MVARALIEEILDTWIKAPQQPCRAMKDYEAARRHHRVQDDHLRRR